MSQGPEDPGGDQTSVKASKWRGHKAALAFPDTVVGAT